MICIIFLTAKVGKASNDERNITSVHFDKGKCEIKHCKKYIQKDAGLFVQFQAQEIKVTYTHVALKAVHDNNKTEEICTVDFDDNDTSNKTCKLSSNDKEVNITVMSGERCIKDCRLMLDFFPTSDCFKPQGIHVIHKKITVEALYAGEMTTKPTKPAAIKPGKSTAITLRKSTATYTTEVNADKSTASSVSQTPTEGSSTDEKTTRQKSSASSKNDITKDVHIVLLATLYFIFAQYFVH
ncbi:uncharacterized protein LOC114533922 isoform X3 [Dendronephthya gigantea]|nr:uncharacterized protein LOC114533922 isoform X3 [Dendronephthya gigantea]